jgi:hypothetical protein
VGPPSRLKTVPVEDPVLPSGLTRVGMLLLAGLKKCAK